MQKLDIRENNELIVLKKIIDCKEISRSDISKTTGLNKATVSSIVNDYIRNGYVEEIRKGSTSSEGGRKPIILSFNPKCAQIISIEIGISYIFSSLTFLDADPIKEDYQENITITRENILSLLEKIITNYIHHSKKSIHGVVAIVIAIHGIVIDDHIIFTPYYDLEGMPLTKLITSKFNIPTYVENEANASALGELTFKRDFNSLVSIKIHSGIGAGIIKDEKLITGDHGQAGEIGHSIIFPNGRPCPCGNRGCLERYASETVILDEINQRYPSLSVTQYNLLSLINDHRKEKEWLIDKIQLLAVGVNNIISFYDPGIVIVNSIFFQICPELFDVLLDTLPSRITKKVIIQPSKLGKYSTILGCITIGVQKFLKIDNLRLNLYSGWKQR